MTTLPQILAEAHDGRGRSARLIAVGGPLWRVDVRDQTIAIDWSTDDEREAEARYLAECKRLALSPWPPFAAKVIAELAVGLRTISHMPEPSIVRLPADLWPLPDQMKRTARATLAKVGL